MNHKSDKYSETVSCSLCGKGDETWIEFKFCPMCKGELNRLRKTTIYLGSTKDSNFEHWQNMDLDPETGAARNFIYHFLEVAIEFTFNPKTGEVIKCTSLTCNDTNYKLVEDDPED